MGLQQGNIHVSEQFQDVQLIQQKLAAFLGWITGESNWHKEFWSGVAGLKAAAADLDGDGKDEIVTLLVGYYHMSARDPSWKIWSGHQRQFDMYPYLAVRSCPRGMITPQHDESHVKGQGIAGGPLATYGANQSTLFGKSVWYHNYEAVKWPLQPVKSSFSGREAPDEDGGYTANYFSMSAGPFTGTLGVDKTVDDVVVAWNNGWDQEGTTSVYLFKTNIRNGPFSGFSNYNNIQIFQRQHLRVSVPHRPQNLNRNACGGLCRRGCGA